MTAESRIGRLPKDSRGYPVPWFVEWVDGKPDFRIMRNQAIVDAVRQHLCWICGQAIGSQRVAFVVGPMCAVNRVSAEPPSHVDCAQYAATHCPFLIKPKQRRAKIADVVDGREVVQPAGVMLERNPGVALVWVTRRWTIRRAPGGVLFNIGEPERTEWYAEAQPATREQVLESINSGLPILFEMAEQDGPAAVAQLDEMAAIAMAFLPA